MRGAGTDATRAGSEDASEPAGDTDKGALLDAALRLAETQLQLQIADEASVDGRTMGLLAFNGALVAADIAAKGLLDGDWWTILPAVGVSTVLCLRSSLAKTSDVGVEAYQFFTRFGAGPSLDTREALLADLNIAFHNNARRVRVKTWSLRIALVSLTIGLVVAAFLISSELSNKIEACKGPQPHDRQSSRPPCRPRNQPGSRTSALPEASSSRSQGELVELAREIEGSRDGVLVKLAASIEAG